MYLEGIEIREKLIEMQLDINRIEQATTKEFWESLSLGLPENLEEAVVKEIFTQLHERLIEVFN